MKILHVMGDGEAGGGPTVVLTLCEESRRDGMTVAVATMRGSHLESVCHARGIEAFGLDFSRRTAVFEQRRAFAAIYRRFRPDVVHAHGSRSMLPLALLRHRSGQRPALVYTVHGFHHAFKSLPGRLLGRRVEWYCARRADATIYVGKGDAAIATREGLVPAGRHRIVYNGVAVPSGIERPLADRRFDIAYMARLHPQKDPLILPDILMTMRPRRPSLIVIGGGELDGALRVKISRLGLDDQITMRGPLPRDEALAQVAQARLFILPSRWEGLPVTLAEAMRLRLAVVASDIAGNDEIVAHGSNGFLVPSGQPQAFADILGRLLDSPALVAEVTDAAHADVIARFSVARQYAEIRACYAAALARA
jgi:glycosyltransferase involved in cell wall biosynthesis